MRIAFPSSVLSSRLARVALVTERLPVPAIPEQFHVSLVRDLVIDLGRETIALHAPGMFDQP